MGGRSTREPPLSLISLGFQPCGRILRSTRRWPGVVGSMFTNLHDRVHRAVQQRPHDRVAILLEYGAVPGKRCVSPVVERKVLRRMLGANAEAVADGAVQADRHAFGHAGSTS